MRNWRKCAAALLLLAFLSGCAAANPASEQSVGPADEQNAGAAGEQRADVPAETVNSEDLSAFQEISAERLEPKAKDEYTDYADAVRIDPAKAGDGYRVGNGTVEIVEAGTYVLSGALNGQLRIAAGDSDDVRVVLENAEIRNEKGAAVYAENADKVILSIPENTSSVLADGASSADGGTVAADCDVVINGAGTLEIEANAKDGVNTKDDLRVLETALSVHAVDDGLVANDGVLLLGASLTVQAGGDGVKATKQEADKGFILVDGGRYDIAAENDGFQAETCLFLRGGDLTVQTGGGAENGAVKTGQDRFGFGTFQTQSGEDTPSAKGLKAGACLEITGGTFALDTADDALHSNGTVNVSGGEIALSSGDDAAHADDTLTFSGGTLTAARCYEGLEAGTLVISGGTADIHATDDGLNAAGGADGSSLMERPGRNAFAADAARSITISGGTLTVDAAGDGIDSNGSVTMTGGEVYVSGPTDSANGVFDFGTTFEISGGTLLGTGSAGMLQIPTGAQGVVAVRASGNAGDALEVRDSEGETLGTAAAPKAFEVVVFSSAALRDGETYTVFVGGSEAGSGVCGENAGMGFGGGFGGRGEFGRGERGGTTGDGQRPAFPGGEAPDGEMPGGDMPEGGAPEGGIPGGGMPNGDMPEGEMPPGVPGDLANT